MRTLVVVVGAFFVVAACGKREAAPPASWEPDRSCATADDCGPSPTCCPSPCGGDPINKRDIAMMQRRVDATCDKKECSKVVAGACVAHMTMCLRGRCTMVMEGSPDWPTKDASAGK